MSAIGRAREAIFTKITDPVGQAHGRAVTAIGRAGEARLSGLADLIITCRRAWRVITGWTGAAILGAGCAGLARVADPIPATALIRAVLWAIEASLAKLTDAVVTHWGRTGIAIRLAGLAGLRAFTHAIATEGQAPAVLLTGRTPLACSADTVTTIRSWAAPVGC